MSEMADMPNAALKLGRVWPLPPPPPLPLLAAVVVMDEFCRSRALVGSCEGNAGSGLGNLGAAVIEVGVNPVEERALEEVLLNLRVGDAKDEGGGVGPLDGIG